MSASPVATERQYRVAGTDVVLSEAETQRCPWCPKRGTCQSCRGSGRIVAYRPGRYGLDWPVAVVALHRGELSGAHAAAGTPKSAPVPPVDAVAKSAEYIGDTFHDDHE